jgi:hypothetical protein
MLDNFITTDKECISHTTISNGYTIDVSGQVVDTKYGGLTYKREVIYVATLAELIALIEEIHSIADEDEVDASDYELDDDF